MAHCLDVPMWRLPTTDELIAFVKGKTREDKPRGNKPTGSMLVVRTQLTQADLYAYLRARFGAPNGFQNFLRSDDSDNLIHWDFNLKAGEVDVYIQGRMRDIVLMVSEEMTDENWKALVLALKADFPRLGREKSRMLKSFEKFVVFQNKFVVLAELCAELHAAIVDAPPLPRITSKRSNRQVVSTVKRSAKRATDLYGDCLKLRLLTPIMAEAFLNMLILILFKPEIRGNPSLYEAFLREKIPRRLELLSVNCDGFARSVDPSSDGYKDFQRVINARNFALHGNVDPVREQIETVYFEGTRPLFADNGDHLLKLFEHLELINAPQDAVRDYVAVHSFLVEVQNTLVPRYREFFEHVIHDPYPGFEVKAKRVTRILPSHTSVVMFPNERRDDDLKVTW